MDGWLLAQLAAAALLPPFSLILVLAAGLVLHRTRRRLAMSLIALSTLGLYALSTPWVSGLLLKTLELRGPVRLDELRDAQALVVLGAGRRIGAAEYGGDTLSPLSVERLRYAAWLARASGLPVLVTGGKPGGGSASEGVLMRDVLRHEYGLTARWVEDVSATTWENASLSAPLLRRDGIRTVALVSHAWHLRRAAPLFAAHGLQVIPAGVQFSSTRPRSARDLVPTASGLRDSAFAAHEWVGILWYKLRSISKSSSIF